MADLPATIYVQDSNDKRVGLVINRSPEGTLDQKIRNAGVMVGIYTLSRLVRVNVTAPQPEVTLADIPIPAEQAIPIVPAPIVEGAAANQN